ncbi:tetratricopeptide repeat protein [Flavobacterium wongokense]|uniref:tetratricopeptide repeat protein n=1 Tax=Flavobacterium wongokense TaxID=2910674 RepID=UPI001F222A33|nr:tetratricopeptide repeat protein [Flavobacterium sp. WG47]MCF6132175.1 tetratricopeptide repeat protein [Flavobacterium sp. WG47]
MEQKLVHIFIASSAEVAEERKKCILILNEINKSHPHLNLVPIEWEYDLPKGNFPDFESIQKAINPHLKKSQLCLFIFNSKIGKYTKEEFELADKLKKKHIPFFKQGFSPKTREEIAKWTELIEFKESLNDSSLYIDYTDLKDFELELNKSLHLYLAQAFPQETTNDNKPLPADVAALLKILTEKQDEIDGLKNSLQLPSDETKQQLITLEREKQELQDELNKSKEFQEQQAKDKGELELLLAPQIENNNLKEKAFIAIKENKYEEAKELLKRSAKDSIQNTSTTFYELGKVSKLQLLYKEALEYFELAARINPSNFDMGMETGNMLLNLGHYDKSISIYERSFSLLTDSEEDQSRKSYVNNQLGIAYSGIGNYDKAISFYEKTLENDKKLYEEGNVHIGTSYSNLAATFWKKNEFDKSIELSKKALEILTKSCGEINHEVAVCNSIIGLAYSGKKEYDNAIKYHEKALQIDLEVFNEVHPTIATRYNNLGICYQNKGETDKAIEYLTLGITIDLKFVDEEHPEIAISYNNLGIAYLMKGEYEKAIQYSEKSINIFKKFLPADHPHIIISEENLKFAKEALGKQQNNNQNPSK